MRILSLNDIYETPSRMHYWCNAAGDINLPSDEDPWTIHTVDELPEALRHLYETYWYEGRGCTEYVVTLDGRNGMALCFLFCNGYKDDLHDKLGMKVDAHIASACYAATVSDVVVRLSKEVPEYADILYGLNTDPDGHEILVFIPEECCNKADFEMLCTKLDKLVYPLFEQQYLALLENAPEPKRETSTFNECFLRIDGEKISMDTLLEKLGIQSNGTAPKVEFCQTVPEGVLTVTADGTNEHLYPGVDVSLELQREHDNTSPIHIARIEREWDIADDDTVSAGAATAFLYGRRGDYIAYSRVDTRADADDEENPVNPSIVVSGNGPMEDTLQVYIEGNASFVNIRGEVPA